MIPSVEDCLIATAAFAILGAVGTLIAFQSGRRTLGLVLAQVGMIGGFAGAAIVATMLARASESAPVIVSTPVWNWFSFSDTHSLAVGFGLEASWTKACLISVTGLIAFVALLVGHYRHQRPFSDDVVLATSFLYAAGVAFVFAPNLAQALLAWGSLSLLSGILIRLARNQDSVESSSKVNISSKRERGILVGFENNISESGSNRGLQAIATWLEFFERFFVNRFWRFVIIQFPASIAEQLGSIESTSTSFQLAATVLCASAVLLTWLMVSV